MISTPIAGMLSSISISRSSSFPSRSILRNFWRVDADSSPSPPTDATLARAGRIRMSRMRSSAASSARRRTFSSSRSRLSLTATSARSRTMDSTSRPTYPTSVNLVASILMNGAPARRARRRAISVLPTPVGPIIRMFLGVISARISSPTCIRRQRLRNAIATARFASA